jgi:hypothetical protein
MLRRLLLRLAGHDEDGLLLLERLLRVLELLLLRRLRLQQRARADGVLARLAHDGGRVIRGSERARKRECD